MPQIAIHLAKHVAHGFILILTITQRLRRVDDVIKVKAGVVIEHAPHETRRIEQQRLHEQHDRHPLVIVYHLLGRLVRYLAVDGQVVGVGNPADLVGVVLVVVGEVAGHPAMDRFTHVLFRAHLRMHKKE